jgi:hypothetical protein
MFNAMRRVISESAISESDDLGNITTRNNTNIPSQQQLQYQQQQQQQQQEYPQQQQQQLLHSPDHQQRANLVEMDSDEPDFMQMDVESDDNRPISHIRKASGQFSSTHSSLSGASCEHDNDDLLLENDGTNDDDMEDTDDGLINEQQQQQQQQEQQQQQQRPQNNLRELVEDPFQHHVKFDANANPNSTMNAMKLSSTATTLQRMDDDDDDDDNEDDESLRASSQNSSRDWGWFEDVHHPSDQPSPGRPSNVAGAANGSGGGGRQKNSNNKGGGGNNNNNKSSSRGSQNKYTTLVPLTGTVRDVVQPQETGT